MFKQEATMGTKKGIDFFFFFNGQNSVTKIKEKEELRKKMFIFVKWYRESSKIRAMFTEMCHMEVSGEHIKNVSSTQVSGGLGQSNDSFLGAKS